MMRIFTMVLLLLNVGVIGWLFAKASMEPLQVDHSFAVMRHTLDALDESGRPMKPWVREAQLKVATRCLDDTEADVRWKMGELRRSDMALTPLTLVNIVGLAVVCFRNGGIKRV